MVALACAAPHVRKPLEEEPFVLSPGPPPSVREALLAQASGAPAAGLTETAGRTAIELAGHDCRLPLVHAKIAGRPTLMLVDSGAYDHVLEGWFAHELQDAEASGKQALIVDHANRTMAVERWSAVSFALDGWSPLAPIRPVTTGDLTPGPRALGVGGILSPQRLATGSAVVLDFPAGEMIALDDASATSRLAARAASLGVALRCGATYVLTASVEGRDAELLVDTGAFATDSKASSVPGRALAGRSSVARDIYAVGGSVPTRMLSDATVKAGKLSVRLDIPLVEDTPARRASRCAGDGVLGMDVLQRCVLAIDAMKMRIACD